MELHPHSLQAFTQYLKAAGHGKDLDGALFRALGGPLNSHSTWALGPGAVYAEVLKPYLAQCDIAGENLGPHALKATAATNALKMARI